MCLPTPLVVTPSETETCEHHHLSHTLRAQKSETEFYFLFFQISPLGERGGDCLARVDVSVAARASAQVRRCFRVGSERSRPSKRGFLRVSEIPEYAGDDVIAAIPVPYLARRQRGVCALKRGALKETEQSRVVVPLLGRTVKKAL